MTECSENNEEFTMATRGSDEEVTSDEKSCVHPCSNDPVEEAGKEMLL